MTKMQDDLPDYKDLPEDKVTKYSVAPVKPLAHKSIVTSVAGKRMGAVLVIREMDATIAPGGGQIFVTSQEYVFNHEWFTVALAKTTSMLVRRLAAGALCFHTLRWITCV